ncbi:MAG TPA: rhodanese-like domain-containing protein [Kofleriaceae bacterium]
MAASVILDAMVHTVTPAELAELVSTQVVDVIDVRDADEWETGHIEGARLVPLEQLRADPDAALARDVATVFVCAKGVRSMQAAKLAERFGYERVYHLAGGTKEWVRAGMPLVVESRIAA